MDLEKLILLSMVNACIAFTITETKIFENFRIWVKSKHSFFGYLFSCGYCLGMWISVLLTIVFQFRIFHYILIIDYISTIFIISWLSAFQWVIFCWLMQKTNK